MIVNVYIDVLFLVNFMMDFLLLRFVGLFLKEKKKPIRYLAGALVGAIYAVGIFFTDISFWAGLLGKAGISSLMVILAFAPCNLQRFLRQICVLYVTAFGVGGLALTLFSRSGLGAAMGAVYSAGVLYFDVPAYLLLFFSLGAYVLLHVAFGVVEKKRIKGSLVYTVKMVRGGKTIRLLGLCDTGNLLKEPVSGRSVILVGWQTVKALFPAHKTLLAAVGEGGERFVPLSYRGIGGQEVLFAFLPDEIWIEGERIDKSKMAYIGITEGKERLFDGFDAILPYPIHSNFKHNSKGADFCNDTADRTYDANSQATVL